MEGLKAAIEFITELKESSMEPKVLEINGNTYCNKNLTRYHYFPKADSLSVNTLTSIVDYIKHKLRKQIKEIMDSPEFQKERQKELDKHTAEAMNCFLLISVDYLYRNYHCKRKGVLKYLEFVLHQMHFAQKDEEYFQLMNEELEREVGVNVLGTLKGE